MPNEFDPYYKWLGIRPDERPITHYRLLGLQSFEGDLDVISNAADQRMASLKTYQIGQHSDHSQRLLNELSRARVCLLNPQKKADYDQSLRAEMARDRDETEDAPSAETGSKKYFCRCGETELGPFSSKEIRRLARRGRLSADDYVKKEGHTGWILRRQFRRT